MKLDEHKLIVFDLDGTLIHFDFDFFHNNSLSILGRIGYAHITRNILEEGFAKYDFFHFEQEDKRSLLKETFWSQWPQDDYTMSPIFQGIPDLLKELKSQGHTLAVATARSTPEQKIYDDLVSAGIGDLFTEIISKASCKKIWYDKHDILNVLCDKTKIKAEDSCMIGDTPPDISSAFSAGFRSAVAVLSGGIHREVLERENPTLILDSVSDLMRYR